MPAARNNTKGEVVGMCIRVLPRKDGFIYTDTHTHKYKYVYIIYNIYINTHMYSIYIYTCI